MNNEVGSICLVETYVSMQFHNDTVPVSQLGASPAELDYCIDSERPRSWHSHDGEAELRLNDTVFDGGE
jgi:hypothetical protein